LASLRELQPWLYPYADYLVRSAEASGFGPVSINSVYRSRQKQAVLYDRFLRGLSAYPVAPPGYSLHEHRLAFDINVRQGSGSPEQAALGAFWNQMGGLWSPRDRVHFTVHT